MKYLLVSDIHGCLPALQTVLKFYDELGCDMLCILGDILNYGPRNAIPEGLDAKGIAELLNAHAEHIVAVRGNCESEVDQMLLRFPILADYLLLVDEGKKLFLTHGHIYNKEEMPPGRFDAVVYGHTHLWELTPKEGTLICNTGSITFPKQGKEPTFMTYERGVFTVYNLNGEQLTEKSIPVVGR
ncbi:UNVERIFIED_CONTAM: phosphodiesterase [Prevotella sp. 15_C9]